MASLSAASAASVPVSFSVIITSHNQAEFIAETVESALWQRHPAREVIVVDDGSTDSSLAILSKYEKRVLLIKLETNRGANAARNIGAQRSSASHLVFLDGDDLMLPWALEVYARVLATNDDSRIVLSSLAFFNGSAKNHRVDEPQTIFFCDYPRLIEKNRAYRASASAIVLERETFFAAGGWTEQIFPMEDLDLIAKLGYCGRTIQVLSPPTKKYRVHAGNTVSHVGACVDMLHRVIERTKKRVYAVPEHPRFQTYAFVGGPAWFWVKRAFHAGFYRDGMKLFADSWLMILAGGLTRITHKVKSQYPVQSVELVETQLNSSAPK